MTSVNVIFEDEDILVIDKPPGLVVDPSNTQKNETLVDWLGKRYDRLVLDSATRSGTIASSAYHTKDAQFRRGMVHRLDKDTSGVLLVGKTQTAFDNLQAQFKERKTKKEYLALVHGLVEKSGVIEGSIGRNPLKREKFSVLLDGKEAKTEYEPIERLQLTPRQGSGQAGNRLQELFADFNKIQIRKLERMGYGKFTLLSCKPLTGRTHQIRVHLKHIGHPVVADEKYVGRKMYRLDKRWCPRQFLHAKRLGFYHPKSGKWVEFESPIPEDLKKALNRLNVNIKNQISK